MTQPISALSALDAQFESSMPTPGQSLAHAFADAYTQMGSAREIQIAALQQAGNTGDTAALMKVNQITNDMSLQQNLVSGAAHRAVSGIETLSKGQ